MELDSFSVLSVEPYGCSCLLKMEVVLHFLRVYRSSFDIDEAHKVATISLAERLEVSGLPSIPCIGRVRFEILGSLVPKYQQGIFANQDFDPYLHQTYNSFNVMQCVNTRFKKLSTTTFIFLAYLFHRCHRHLR